jgi:acetate kinase
LKKNSELHAKEAVISRDGSKVKVLVVPTNEELVIAEDTVRIISKTNNKAVS